MKYFYIPKNLHFIFIILIIFLGMISWWSLLLAVVLLYSTLLLLFRKRRGVFKEYTANINGVLYSPVYGKIVKITSEVSHPNLGDGFTEVLIRMPPFAEYGIYLPLSSEVKELIAVKGREHFRYSSLDNIKIFDRAGAVIVLENEKDDKIGLQIFKCRTGFWPQIKVMAGDRGKYQSNIGILPLGGTLGLYIQNKYEILVQEGQDVMAGETLIAGRN